MLKFVYKEGTHEMNENERDYEGTLEFSLDEALDNIRRKRMQIIGMQGNFDAMYLRTQQLEADNAALRQRAEVAEARVQQLEGALEDIRNIINAIDDPVSCLGGAARVLAIANMTLTPAPAE